MTNITNFSFLKSAAFWSGAVSVVSAFLTALEAQYPAVAWIPAVVSILGFISMNYFHTSDVNKAVAASLALGKPAHGQ